MSDLDAIQRSAQQQFDRQSDRYGKSHILADVSDVAAIITRVPEKNSKLALDVATGGGHTGLYLASQGWQVTLADIAPGMLEKARALAVERQVKVETRQHTAEQFPYPDASFDLVTCRVAAHHFSSVEKFTQESARVLRKGGALVVIDGSVEDDQPEAEVWLHQVEKLRDPSHGRFLTPRQWTRLCELAPLGAGQAGLRVQVCELHPFKQPDLNWYFDTANTSPENRKKVLELVRNIPASARQLYRLTEEAGKIVWWWQRLTLLAVKDR